MVVEWCAHLAVWIATAVAYRVGKTGKDLWGWSCSTAAQDIQKTFPEVNFDFLCSFQVSFILLTPCIGLNWLLIAITVRVLDHFNCPGSSSDHDGDCLDPCASKEKAEEDYKEFNESDDGSINDDYGGRMV